jgi:dihydroflavonol-4-reductase
MGEQLKTADLVLVTGARGFLGWHVAKLLLKAGAKVRGLTRSQRAPLPEEDPGIDWYEGDLTRFDELTEPLQGCRYLFHVAGDYRFWTRSPAEIFAANVDGTRNVLDAAWRAGVEKVVYTSTCGILAPKKTGEQTEQELADEGKLVGHYKRSKRRAYAVVEERTRHGWPIVTVLPTAPIGPCDLRPTPTGRIIIEFLRGRIPMIAKTGLNFVDVRDVAAGHLLALHRGISGSRYLLGCHNLWLREFLTRLEPFTKHRAPRVVAPYWLSRAVAEVEERLAQVTGKEPFAAREAVENSRHPMFFSSSKAIFEMGYEPTGIDRAIREAVEYFRARGMA